MDNNRFRRFSQDHEPVRTLQDKIKDGDKGKKQDVKIKKPIDIFKLSLRTMLNKLVAINNWALPNDYTLRLAKTIETMIEDAIKYNNMYAEHEFNDDQADKPSLPNPRDQMPQADHMINSLIDEINKTVKKNNPNG